MGIAEDEIYARLEEQYREAVKILIDELEIGSKSAKSICEHLRRMGADQMKFPIESENSQYLVEVKRLP